ncbi:TonB family protein [Tellurirhabdus bombi]|uniref:TonB family protein n=1 Tax=Tellurirhabdus bombi TaxID=2907205 RepID=UPI001F346523
MSTSSYNQYFPGYEILGELGRSNARVLKARNQITGELVAIKHFSLQTDAVTLQRFQRESEIMTSIGHPNIVKVKEVHLDATMPYIVMELIEGGDLRKLLKTSEHNHLDVATTVRLGLQMAEAFRVIHEKGIIHRDIKPENIMYRELPSGELHFLLTDFGIAKLREHPVTVTGQSVMTYEYASPEQFDNLQGVEAATDYYSLGVVLYECLSGKVPFELVEGGMRTFVNRVVEMPPPPLILPNERLLPESMRALVLSLLEKDAAKRLHDADDLIVELNQANIEQLRARKQKRQPTATFSTEPALPVSPTPPTYVDLTENNPYRTSDEPPKAKNDTWKIGLLILAILFAVYFGVQYYQNRAGGKTVAGSESNLPETLAPSDSAVTDEPESEDIGVNDTVSEPTVAESDSTTTTASTTDSVFSDNQIFTTAERLPEFPGGQEALYEWLSKNIRYPEEAMRANVSGRVSTSFVVNIDGSIQDIEILKGLGFGIDQEAIRLIEAMPRWKPGTQSGRSVRVRYNLPMNFRLEE